MNSAAIGINNKTKWWLCRTFDGIHAFLYSNGVMSDLGTFGACTASPMPSRQRQVVGDAGLMLTPMAMKHTTPFLQQWLMNDLAPWAALQQRHDITTTTKLWVMQALLGYC